ncbi:MAG: NAD-glutamate dehydrogenase [Acidimicrobiales bacterium]|nr:NAD-glutamate dehydrogenase [Acidimicrobiales bacterium]MCB9393161.1 NAD-glutamate dehydrogenase [Acidimicrobiaceae bacterium]
MALPTAIGQTTDDWLAATRAALGPAAAVLDRLAPVLPAGYDELNYPPTAALDLPRVVALADTDGDVSTAVFKFADAAPDEWRFRVYRRGDKISLADLLPLLDHLGMRANDERAFAFQVADDTRVFLHDVGVTAPVDADLADPEIATELCRAFEAAFRGEIESDGFNRLVLAAGLSARQAEVVRAFAKYLRQIGFPLSPQFVESAVVRHHSITASIVELFEVRFDPSRAGVAGPVESTGDPSGGLEDEIRERIARALDEVPSLDDDRTLRALLALVDATVRTNVFRSGDRPGTHRDVMAFKFDPSRVPDLPLPRPMFEIWVCSPRVEGVHLRGGRIARGGLRWSDRREDFRTEVLGLVKAQMVKNAVIVPTGAKGGFVPKRATVTPDEFRAEGVACYRQFIGGLLDLTDNLVGGVVVPPPETVRYDGDDPYLVVAADKGTATFSDIANEISARYGFWLGDAFASGGSAGYDHKEMGITARGAWESVRRHARVIGKDADRDPLTVVGIGDMSGDVFGNGLLRSPHLRLVAAFDHRHVFLDPDPDPATSYAERLRLFALPRSSWADYDPELISAGGGVHPRTAKRIELTAVMQRVLGTDRAVFTPTELIGAILRAPVDVLWNGGIGTYVKASTESHAEVGDRANDSLRVNGDELRCTIVGEGGNLGFTQRGRIEYAVNGGLINTDAIDNSAGVDCSDHEVNIKILLSDVVAGAGMTLSERDELLTSMTDEVAEQVLDDNRAQTLVLSIARRQALPMANVHARYLNTLETEGWINRGLEFLPTDKQIAERQAGGTGLTTPEFAVLLAYTKTTNIELVAASSLPDEPSLEPALMEYFPAPLRDRFAEQIRRHPLRREIVATQLGNQMVNISGISFDHRVTEDTGVGVVDVARAWIAARDVFDVLHWWDRIESVGPEVRLDVQLDLFLELRGLIERAVSWIMRHRRPPVAFDEVIAQFREPMRVLASAQDDVLCGRMRELTFALEAGRLAAGVPERLAQRSAAWPLMHTMFDVVEQAQRKQRPAVDVARSYWQVFDAVDVGWLWDAIGQLPRADRWQTQARSALRDDLLAALAELNDDVVDCGGIVAWRESNERVLARTSAMFSEIRRAAVTDVATLSVALRQVRNLVLTTVAG